MAEVNLSSKQGGRRRPPAPRVDLTPMVDLGFLLISFFMFTTTLMEQKSLELNLPIPTDANPMAFVDTSTLTVIPVADHKVTYYEGSFEDNKLVNTTMEGIRTKIQLKQRNLRRLPSTFSVDAHKLHVVIKPAPSSTYADLISIMDEMTLNAVPVYVLDELSAEERIAVQQVLR